MFQTEFACDTSNHCVRQLLEVFKYYMFCFACHVHLFPLILELLMEAATTEGKRNGQGKGCKEENSWTNSAMGGGGFQGTLFLM
jgi:triphosphoribosyl-dephospho-CoA synthetase